MKNILIVGGLVLVLLVGGAWWSRSLSENDPNTVSVNGIHWHPTLAIYVTGEKMEIPANIGIGAVHEPMHTHSEDAPAGVIHLEFSGTVIREDLKLGRFFEIWGRDIRSFGENIHMTVNDVENTEYENYELQDGDVVELHYE